MYGFRAVEGSHNFFALLEFDITDLRKTLREKRARGEGGSLFAFFLKAIGKCLEAYPVFNSLIDKRKTSFYDTVDVCVPIEVEKDGEVFNKQYVVRDVNGKTIKEITEEIEASKRKIDDAEGFVGSKVPRMILSALPEWAFLAIMRFLFRNHRRVKELSGTIFVTSVSMFSNVPGFVIPYSGGPKAASIAIGSSVEKPVVKDEEIRIREIINVTAAFNHDIVDGAPAARFINRLRKSIESDYGSLI